MLEARIDGFFLRRLFDSILPLVNEVNILFDEKGLSFTSMHESKVAFIEVCLLSSKFNYYRCDEPVTLGIDVKGMCKALHSAGPGPKESEGGSSGRGSEVTLVNDPGEEEQVLKVTVRDGADANANIVKVDTRLLSLKDDGLQKDNDCDYDCTVTMESKVLKSLIDRFAKSYDLITFQTEVGVANELKKERERASGTTGATGDEEETGETGENGETKAKEEEDTTEEQKSCLRVLGTSPSIKLESVFRQTANNRNDRFLLRINSPVSESFDYKYLKDFVRLTSLLPQVKVCLSTAQPMLVAFTVTDSRELEEYGHVRYYLAPRVADAEEDEEEEEGEEGGMDMDEEEEEEESGGKRKRGKQGGKKRSGGRQRGEEEASGKRSRTIGGNEVDME